MRTQILEGEVLTRAGGMTSWEPDDCGVQARRGPDRPSVKFPTHLNLRGSKTLVLSGLPPFAPAAVFSGRGPFSSPRCGTKARAASSGLPMQAWHLQGRDPVFLP